MDEMRRKPVHCRERTERDVMLGGELARAFGAHPLWRRSTTAHVSTENTDAAFYEWLNATYFMRLFEDKSDRNQHRKS